MDREIIDPSIINGMIADYEHEVSMEGVKEGSITEELLDLDNEKSIFSQYVKRKTEEFESTIENFDEEIEQIIDKRDAEKDGEEAVIVAGGHTYTDFEEDEEEPLETLINKNKIIDDLI